MDLGHWTTKLDIPLNAFGFVYLITCNVSSSKRKFYIGKKQMLSKRKKPPLKGKTRKRSVIIETDWKDYTSSSVEMNELIEKYGKENFSFEIIRFCCSKSELAYYEAKEQFAVDALLKEEYINGIVNLRVSKIKVSE